MSMRATQVSLVVAMDREQVIGRDGKLPWHLPNDLRRFRAITMGKPIIMGRRTHESIGRPLPGRRNIVLSSDPTYQADGCDVYAGLVAALDAVADAPEAMIIGGAALYRDSLPLAQRLYLTAVDTAVSGDVHFPAFDWAEWRETSLESHPADETHAWPYRFIVLDRISAPPAGATAR